jgi:hypothetical protein
MLGDVGVSLNVIGRTAPCDCRNIPFCATDVERLEREPSALFLLGGCHVERPSSPWLGFDFLRNVHNTLSIDIKLDQAISDVKSERPAKFYVGLRFAGYKKPPSNGVPDDGAIDAIVLRDSISPRYRA